MEVATILNRSNHEYLIVGGWSPYLRNSTPLVHPGTKDVDILLPDATVVNGIDYLIEEFLSKGFLPSAKHHFQLLKPIAIGEQELVFNIDLLHPSETINNPEMHVDHFDLHILETEFGKPFHLRSIVLPSSQLLFEGKFFDNLEVTTASGKNAQIPIVNEVGCILSKCESVKFAKRKRDAFDIYLSCVNIGKESFVATLENYKDLRGVRQLLDSLKTFLSEMNEERETLEFDLRVHKFAPETPHESPAAFVQEFLDSV